MQHPLHTIGHSNHSEGHFVALLAQHRIQVVADVRSSPYSRMYPQFNREELKRTLNAAGIRYVFLGNELGARTSDTSCYVDGRVQFDRLARTELFQSGLDRVVRGAAEHRVALMCSEKEPLDCHRTILVCRHAASRGLEIHHIHADGSLESHAAALDRLAASLPLKSAELHLFRGPEELLDDTYKLQERRIAYRPAVDAEDADQPIQVFA